MKSIQKFVCEECLQEYETEAECVKCESKHWEVKEITKKFYLGSVIEERAIPTGIQIEFTNGEKISYTNFSANNAKSIFREKRQTDER